MRTEYVSLQEFQKMLMEIKDPDYRGPCAIDPNSDSIIVRDYMNGVYRIQPNEVKQSTQDAVNQYRQHLQKQGLLKQQTLTNKSMPIADWIVEHTPENFDDIKIEPAKSGYISKTDFDEGWEACVDKLKEFGELDALTQMKIQTYLDKVKDEI